jgi:hypothetical protein
MTWSFTEVNLLRDNYGVLPVVAIASILGRKPNTVVKKAGVMGLKSTLPHAVKLPVGSIATLRAHGYSARKIGRLIGCSHKGVRYAEQNHTITQELS